MEIKNKTKRPLKVPLPGGKLLRLSPGGVGQIAPKAAEHAAVKKLLEAGDVEIVGEGSTRGTGGSAGPIGPGSSGGGSGGVRHTGDR